MARAKFPTMTLLTESGGHFILFTDHTQPAGEGGTSCVSVLPVSEPGRRVPDEDD